MTERIVKGDGQDTTWQEVHLPQLGGWVNVHRFAINREGVHVLCRTEDGVEKEAQLRWNQTYKVRGRF